MQIPCFPGLDSDSHLAFPQTSLRAGQLGAHLQVEAGSKLATARGVGACNTLQCNVKYGIMYCM